MPLLQSLQSLQTSLLVEDNPLPFTGSDCGSIGCCRCLSMPSRCCSSARSLSILALFSCSLSLFLRWLVLLGRRSFQFFLGQQLDLLQRLGRWFSNSRLLEGSLSALGVVSGSCTLFEVAWVGLEQFLLLVAAPSNGFGAGELDFQTPPIEEVVVRIQKRSCCLLDIEKVNEGPPAQSKRCISIWVSGWRPKRAQERLPPTPCICRCLRMCPA